MGRDKAFLPYAGLPLWRVQIEKLYSLAPEHLFIAAREDQGFADLICESPECVSLVADPVGENDGPLPAIIRCLRATRSPLLVLAVDMPRMSAAFLQKILRAGLMTSRGVVPRLAGACEPLAALYTPAMLPLMERARESGGLSLQNVIHAAIEAGVCDAHDLTEDQTALFVNWNAPGDVADGGSALPAPAD